MPWMIWYGITLRFDVDIINLIPFWIFRDRNILSWYVEIFFVKKIDVFNVSFEASIHWWNVKVNHLWFLVSPPLMVTKFTFFTFPCSFRESQSPLVIMIHLLPLSSNAYVSTLSSFWLLTFTWTSWRKTLWLLFIILTPVLSGVSLSLYWEWLFFDRALWIKVWWRLPHPFSNLDILKIHFNLKQIFLLKG